MAKANKTRGVFVGVLCAAVVLFWGIYTAAVFTENDIVYNLFSPLTALAAFVLILMTADRLGAYKNVALFFAAGIFFWLAADVMLFIYTYYMPNSELLYRLSDDLYLMPDYMFFFAIGAYGCTILKKQNILRLFVDSFIMAYAGFVVITNVFGVANNIAEGMKLEMVSTLLYFFSILYSMTMMIYIIIETGLKNHRLGWYFITLFLIVYNVFEARYTYYKSQNLDPESIYLDVIYLGSIVGYALALSLTRINADDEVRRGSDIKVKLQKNQHFVMINGFAIFMLAVVLYIAGFISSTELYGMLIVSLAYVVVHKSIESGELYRELLEMQKDENARLERIVEEKTHALREMNDHLEKISSVDMLTELYNRRYLGVFAEGLFLPEVRFAVYSIDLDHFKPVNDKYGHDMGDFVLKKISSRFADISPENCTAFRMGGDEFMIILKTDSDDKSFGDKVDSVARKICEVSDMPIVYEGNNKLIFELAASIGVAVCPDNSSDMDELIKFADSAMYDIKHTSEKSCYKIYAKN